MSKDIIDSVEKLQERLKKMRAAQKEFATFSQEKVDAIFYAAAMAADKARIPLAKLAVEETGMAWRIRLSKTISLQSTSTTHTKTQRR